MATCQKLLSFADVTELQNGAFFLSATPPRGLPHMSCRLLLAFEVSSSSRKLNFQLPVEFNIKPKRAKH